MWLICGYSTVFAADYPSWWTNSVHPVITNTVSTNDWAAANLGQLKWFATNAFNEFETKLPGGAGTNISNMVAAFSRSNNYVAINIGQLKNVAAPFWARLIESGCTNTYPWTTNTIADDNDFAVANIGQLKYVFGFNLSDLDIDSDSDGLLDSWELSYFGNLNQSGSDDPDSDGLNNLSEFVNGTNPNNADTDSDAMPDKWEVDNGLNPLVNDAALDSDGDSVSNLQEYLEGTDPVRTNITDTENTLSLKIFVPLM